MLTVLLFTSSDSRDDGRLTKQFFRCISDNSTGAACPLLGAIAYDYSREGATTGIYKLKTIDGSTANRYSIQKYKEQGD